jgi:hypothetical protein
MYDMTSGQEAIPSLMRRGVSGDSAIDVKKSKKRGTRAGRAKNDRTSFVAMLALAAKTGVMDVAVRFLKTSLVLGILVVLVFAVWFLVNYPPRPGGPHNFARGATNETAAAFRDMISRFWEFYGGDVEGWWSGLIRDDAKDALKEVCDEWRDRGAETVFNTIYLDTNRKPNVRKGDIGFDIQRGFYAYPDRDMSGFDNISSDDKERLRIEPDDGEWPLINRTVTLPKIDASQKKEHAVDPAADFDLWFDYETFDPRQKVDHEDPQYDLEHFLHSMLAVQRHQLLMCALPRFVETLHAKHTLFRHVPVSEIVETVEWIEEHGVDFKNPDKLPEFMLRLGVKRSDAGCVKTAAGRLRSSVERIDSLFVSRMHGTIAGNIELTKAIALSVDPSTLVDLNEVTACDLASRIECVKAEKNSALYFANQSIKTWRGVMSAAGRLADMMESGYVNVTIVTNFVASSSNAFENAMNDFLKCMVLADLSNNTSRTALSAEYALWHRALDVLRAIQDDTLNDALEQLEGLKQYLESKDNAILRACGSDVEARATAMYHEYVNAVNCAVYVQGKWKLDSDGNRMYSKGYLDDAKMKHNARYTNPIAAENFYATYFKDLYEAYWNKDTYEGGIPRLRCTDCFKPHVSPLGTVYDIESLKEYTIRFWQSRGGIGKSLIDNYKRSVTSSLRNTLKDCEMSSSVSRKLLGSEFDGRGYYGGYGPDSEATGYYGGTSNRIHVYKVSMPGTKVVWSIADGDWITFEAPVEPSWTWDKVAHGEDIVFEECHQGGTVIYTRYPAGDSYHRFANSDKRGSLNTDNKFFMGAMNFSLCKAGGRRADAQPDAQDGGRELQGFGDYGDIDATSFSQPGYITEDDIAERARSTTYEEGFEAEPSAERTADYCYGGDWDDMSGAGDQDGLFHVVDVEPPPERLVTDSERRVNIFSLGERLPEPQHALKKLLTLGYDRSTETFRPTLINDMPINRGRSVLTLTITALSTTSEVIIGFPTKSQGYYPYFLNDECKRDSVQPPRNIKRHFWLFILPIFLPILAMTGVGLMTALAALGTVAAVGTLPFMNVRTKQAVAVALETGQIIKNTISDQGNLRNPFSQKQFRYMLVLEKPGLWPEFTLVPYRKPTRTIGSDMPDNTKSVPEAKIVPRDHMSGASRVVLIPAKERAGQKFVHPPIVTEHVADNFLRKGMPYYIFAPNKMMFLVPAKIPYWVSSDGDPSDTPFWIRLQGTPFVWDVRKRSMNSGAMIDLHKKTDTKHDNQVFRRRYADDSASAWKKHNMAFKLSTHGQDMCVSKGKDDSLVQAMCASGVEWRHVAGRMVTSDGSYAQAEKKRKGGLTGRLVLSRTQTDDGTQQFEIVPVHDCAAGTFEYGEKELISGVMPGLQCIKPWYLYEMSHKDMTEEQRKRVDEQADRNA